MYGGGSNGHFTPVITSTTDHVDDDVTLLITMTKTVLMNERFKLIG